ncbi:MAG: hypothetical protein A2284_03550 [Deltaproteobacteria bacterium RIFOXYA12_FULL_61_11]|nr:MAG: hypothetical protein A2284_03550 [Deltaproteobacteria bacterium RIFOXYA12_FULL_61_11]
MRRTNLILMLPMLCSFAACGGDEFDPYGRLTGLRLLAIKAEPPSPGPGEKAVLSALVYTPPEAPPVTYAWSWCPFAGPSSQGYPCLMEETDFLGMLSQAGVEVPAYALGTDATVDFSNTLAPALAALCNGLLPIEQEFDCEGGFAVQVRLTITSGEEEVSAVQSLRLRHEAGLEANANPVLNGLVAVQDEGEYELSADPSSTLEREKKNEIKALFDENEAEQYTGKDSLGVARLQRERLILSWFVESGHTKHERTSFVEGIAPLKRAATNTWLPGPVKDYDRTSATLYVILRDNRGGIDWALGRVFLKEAE